MKRIILILVYLLLLGCAPITYEQHLANRISGIVGCSPESIIITNLNRDFVSKWWEAECNGNHYQCAMRMTTGDISCSAIK